MAVYYQAPCEVGRRKEFLASDFRGAFFAAVIPPHGDESPFPACPGKEHYGSAKLAGRCSGLSLIFDMSGLRDLSEITPEP